MFYRNKRRDRSFIYKASASLGGYNKTNKLKDYLYLFCEWFRPLLILIDQKLEADCFVEIAGDDSTVNID